MRPPRVLASLVALSLLIGAAPARAADPHLREDGQRDGRVHLQLDSHFLFGIGGQSFLGGQVGFAASLQHWTTRHALGTWDFGAQLGYHAEPVFLAPWIDSSTTQGATHRVQLLATAGHTFHMGKRRRWSLGMHLYAGLNHWRSDYTVTYEAEDVHGSAVVTRNDFVVGGQLKVAYRFHRHFGVGIVLGGPFPTESSYQTSMFHVGAGLVYYLR